MLHQTKWTYPQPSEICFPKFEDLQRKIKIWGLAEEKNPRKFNWTLLNSQFYSVFSKLSRKSRHQSLTHWYNFQCRITPSFVRNWTICSTVYLKTCSKCSLHVHQVFIFIKKSQLAAWKLHLSNGTLFLLSHLVYIIIYMYISFNQDIQWSLTVIINYF